MDPLLTRKHNSYSEAFASYLASALRPKTYPDVMVTIRRFAYEDGMVHLHRVLHKGSPDVVATIVFEFNNENEDITMMCVSPEDLTHFAKLVEDNGQLNRDLLHRMQVLLSDDEKVRTAVEGVHHWPDLLDVFLGRIYEPVSS